MNPITTHHGAGTRACLGRTRAFAALALLGSTLTAIAQTVAPATTPGAPRAEGEVVRLETFVTTGTRFNDRTVVESPVPIDVVTRNDLEQGGYTEVSQMLQAAVPSFNFPRPSLTDGTDHIRPATLRGLAPDQTLVLVNGKRRHSSALVNVNGSVGRGSVSVDFNAFPSSAIERVEVLRDGASAQYGSDAIAGVINVILRKDRGWGVDLTWGETSEGDGRDMKVAVSGGVPAGENGDGVLFMTAFARDHDPTNRIQPDTRQQYFGNGGASTISGNYGSGTGLSPSNGTRDAREATIDRMNHRFGDPRAKEMGVFGNLEMPLQDNMEFYAFGGATRRHGEGAGFFRRPGDDRTVRAIYPNGFLPMIQSEVWDYSIGGGFSGRDSGWDWDLSTVWGANELDYTVANSANVTLGNASKTSFDAGQLAFRQWTTNFDLTNEFQTGWRSPLKLAIGAEYRWEEYEISPGEPDSYRDGGVRVLDGPNAGALGAVGAQVFPGFRPSDAGKRDRTSYAVYADVETDLTERWMVSGAVRFEDYSDFGNETTAKLASRLGLNDAFALRGSLSTGFRAPHLAQQGFSSTATNFIGGVPFENKTFPVSDPVAVLLGAAPLKAETSTNMSLGVTWQPTTGFSASVDFYQIEIDDRVVLSSNFVDPAGVSLIRGFLAANGQPQATGGRYFTNAVDTETRGVDLNARYTWRTDALGRFTFTAGANFNETEVKKIRPTPAQLQTVTNIPIFDLTEQIRMEESQPKNTINLSASWDLDKFTFLVRTVRYGEVSTVAFPSLSPAAQAVLLPGYDVRLAPALPGIAQSGSTFTLVPTANSQVIQTFGAKWITDFDVTYRWRDDVTFSVGVNNAFDVYPDENIRSRVVGGAATNGSDNVGIFPYNSISPFGFNGMFYYGKLSYKF
jgi:iron complex outermembrane recepter protein